MSTVGRNRYAIVMEWSDPDDTYVVTLPEWDVHTHGDTHPEVLQRAEELLNELIADAQENGEPLPTPRLFASV
jgi:predicted RNase H-like HicB family nuclease